MADVLREAPTGWADAVTSMFDVGYLTGSLEGTRLKFRFLGQYRWNVCLKTIRELMVDVSGRPSSEIGAKVAGCSRWIDDEYKDAVAPGPEYSSERLDVARKTAREPIARLALQAFDSGYKVGVDDARPSEHERSKAIRNTCLAVAEDYQEVRTPEVICAKVCLENEEPIALPATSGDPGGK